MGYVFQPSVVLDEIYDLIQSLLCKLDKDKTISLTDSIIPMGFEIIDKIRKEGLSFADFL